MNNSVGNIVDNGYVSIPKYLIIKINTRIKNARKVTYVPKMTDRKTTYQRVLFDPLIELKKSAITGNPFLNPSLFQIAKDKSLQSQFFGQKKKNFKQAVNSGFIENNIQVTLDVLFKKNTPFYINNKTYKVHSYLWDKKWDLSEKRPRSVRRYGRNGRYSNYGSRYGNYGRNRPYNTRRRQYGGEYAGEYERNGYMRNGSYIYVNIYLELYPPEGTPNKKNMDCLSKYEKLKMEWASLTDTEYNMEGTLD